MVKGRRIKHYNKIYKYKADSVRITPWKIFFTLVLVAVLGFIGWSIYGPVYDFVMGLNNEDLWNSRSSSSESSSNGSEIQSSLAGQAPPEANHSSTSQVPTTVIENGKMQAVYMPFSIALNSQRCAAFVASAKSAGMDSILLDIKDDRGNLFFSTDNAIAIKASAINENAPMIENAIKIIKEAGMQVIGKMPVFKDSITPKWNENAQIMYMGTEYTWLDSAPQSGGKQWLNPYSSSAREYILDLALDAVNLGVDIILFDSVQFPTGEALEKASYGAASAGKTKSQALAEFAQYASQQLNTEKSGCIFYTTAYNSFYPNDYVYGGKSLDIYQGNVALGLMPMQFGDTLVLNGQSHSNNPNQPQEVVGTVLSNLSEESKLKAKVGFLQAFDSQNNQALAEGVVKSQIETLGTHGISSYILYNPQGQYLVNGKVIE